MVGLLYEPSDYSDHQGYGSLERLQVQGKFLKLGGREARYGSTGQARKSSEMSSNSMIWRRLQGCSVRAHINVVVVSPTIASRTTEALLRP